MPASWLVRLTSYHSAAAALAATFNQVVPVVEPVLLSVEVAAPEDDDADVLSVLVDSAVFFLSSSIALVSRSMRWLSVRPGLELP
jgi:hypothetical protein